MVRVREMEYSLESCTAGFFERGNRPNAGLEVWGGGEEERKTIWSRGGGRERGGEKKKISPPRPKHGLGVFGV